METMSVEDVDSNLQMLVKTGNWDGILKLGANLSFDQKVRYLWVWPTKDNLKQLKSVLSKLKIYKILSIGCGCGLLEWLIEASSGVSVFGLEVDHSWWESSYSLTPFINLNYIEDNLENSDYMQTCCQTANWDFALLFCYFNNRPAFLDYMKHYKGSCVIIIGPGGAENGTHTDPNPFLPGFDENQKWTLLCSYQIDITKDFLAIYVLS